MSWRGSGRSSAEQYLVTGGAGFIGINYADRLLARGQGVTIYDNLSRRGARANLEWLRSRHGDRFVLVAGDVRDAGQLAATVADADVIVHLAAQVAVTTSLTDPRQDFDINAAGTLNLLEAARASHRRPLVLFASTNKVYGNLAEMAIAEDKTRYRFTEQPLGIAETCPLHPHTPYGCSKAAADQYVRDYHRIYGLQTVVLRQSCIYGPRQFGVEDQGWVAWFIIAALSGRPITIFGNGKQVRDLLHIDDLMHCFDLVIEHRDEVSGDCFNIGGGPDNTISAWQEFGPLLEQLLDRKITVGWADWRTGDQAIFVADIRKAHRLLGWQPQVDASTGVRRLIRWIEDNHDLLAAQ